MKSLAATCVALTMLATGVPTTARAEPAAPAPSTAMPDDAAASTRELARAQFQAGLARYETGDYAGAIQSWTLAHELMATDPEAAGARHVLGLDLAQAHVRAYRIDGDRSHFDPAERLIDDYIAWVDRPGHTMDVAEQEDRPRALEMLAFLEDQRAARAGAPVVETPSVTPRPAATRIVADGPPKASPSAHTRRNARILIATGAGSLGLTIGASIGLVVLAFRGPRIEAEYERVSSENHMNGEHGSTPELEALERQGRRTNMGVIACATGVAVFGVTGIALLTTGLVQRRRMLRATPTVAQRYAGLMISGRF